MPAHSQLAWRHRRPTVHLKTRSASVRVQPAVPSRTLGTEMHSLLLLGGHGNLFAMYRVILLLITACAAVLACDSAPVSSASAPPSAAMDIPPARANVVEDRFARLALSCVEQEFPNKISHVLTSDADVRPPRELTPAFYGCFDWHSSVHGHWLLVRVLVTEPATPMRAAILRSLSANLTEENIAEEVSYFSGPERASFERPYGIAWFLQLVAELHESENPQLLGWRENLRPLETLIIRRIHDWLPKLSYPVRLGTHNQTAFAFGLMIDYARTVGNSELEALVSERALAFHMNDKDCPLTYEPSGEDFLSPCLMEADLMRRILRPADFSTWLDAFLPNIPRDGNPDWLEAGIVLDASDGKLVHLDGVNLSRAWALEGISHALPVDDPRQRALLASANMHRTVGIAAVSDEHYEGGHWLGSFATYLTTKRGIIDQKR